MTQLMLLEPAYHKDMKIDVKGINAAAATLHMSPVVPSEFAAVAASYPIVFTKHAATGQFSCVALFGFEPQENLYWVESQWDAPYVPLNIRRQPFFIGNDSDDSEPDNFVVCFDKASTLINNTNDNGTAVFEADGQASNYLNNVQEMLAALLDGEQQLAGLVDALIEHKLLTPMTVDVEFTEGQAQRVNGLYGIDEEALKALPDEAALFLHQQGYLAAIHAMLVSSNHIHSLVERKNKRLAAGSAWFKTA